jgi:hypothetical protein
MRALVSHLTCHRRFCDQRRRLEGTEIWAAYNECVWRELRTKSLRGCVIVWGQRVARTRVQRAVREAEGGTWTSFLPTLLAVSHFSYQSIRGAIPECETQLIDSVKEDVKRLHDKVY